ncbi:MAG: Rho termination factor N-terminal domain-containing protein [Spirulina sp.]
MSLSDVGNLMCIPIDEIEPGETPEIHQYVLQFTARQFNGNSRNWIPVIVKEIGLDRYQVIANSFVYAAAVEAGLEEIWCIIAEDTPEVAQLSQALAQETPPKTNLSTAERDEISAALDYLMKQPGTSLKGVRSASVVARLDEAPREYWQDLKPITKLGCGITGAAKLKALEQVFYLTPQPIPEITTDCRLLEMMTVGELKAMAKKQGLTDYTKLKQPDLVKLLSNPPEPRPEATSDSRPLEKMTIKELKAMAEEKGLTGFAKFKKPELVKLLAEAD